MFFGWVRVESWPIKPHSRTILRPPLRPLNKLQVLLVIFLLLIFVSSKDHSITGCVAISPRMHSVSQDRLSAGGWGQTKEATFHKQNHLFFKTQEASVHSKIMTFKKAKITVFFFFVRHRIDNEESFETLGQTAPLNTKSLSHDRVALNFLVFKRTNFFFCTPLLTSSSPLYSHLFERHSSILEFFTSRVRSPEMPQSLKFPQQSILHSPL